MAIIIQIDRGRNNYMQGYDESNGRSYTIADLEQMAAKGNIDAQCAMGDYYATDEKLDFDRGMTWYEKAANQGNVKAQWMLGGAYFTGMGKPKNIDEAERWLLRAAQSGFVEAQSNVGILYMTEKSDIVKAEYWLSKAADQGHPEASIMIGAVKTMLNSSY
jgi:hypothetical protein